MFNRMRSLPIPAAGVVIASGGNAGIAVATAARALGVPCEVFLPELASPAKRQALAALGATRGRARRGLRRRAGGLPAAPAADRRAADARLRPARGGGRRRHAGRGDRRRGRAARPRARQRRRRRARRRHRGLVRRPHARGGAGAARLAHPARRARGGRTGGRGGVGPGRRRAGRAPHRQHRLADLPASRRGRRTWSTTRPSPRRSSACGGELRLAVEPAAALPLAALGSGVVQPAPHERVALVLCGANFDPATLAAAESSSPLP